MKIEVSEGSPEGIKQTATHYESLILKQIGVFINNKRNERHITVRGLNGMTGVSIGVISDLENQRCMPRIETLLRICEALDIPFNDLFENMKLSKSTIIKGGKEHTEKIDKFDRLSKLLAGLEDSEYTKEDISEIVSYVKYLDYKKSAKK